MHTFERHHHDWLFEDRADAGRQLAAALPHLPAGTVVIGIPRGGVGVAAEVAGILGAELDVVVARKIGAPGREEFALGAITADGTAWFNYELITNLGVSASWLANAARFHRTGAEQREAALREVAPAIPLAGRPVVIVDDGLATGATMRAAIRTLRQQSPSRIVVAVPVGAADTCRDLEALADEVVCPNERDDFGAVGLWYRRFEQLGDAEVRSLLCAARARRRTHAGRR
jgi:putative phosphoribosyl transferase